MHLRPRGVRGEAGRPPWAEAAPGGRPAAGLGPRGQGLGSGRPGVGSGGWAGVGTGPPGGWFSEPACPPRPSARSIWRSGVSRAGAASWNVQSPCRPRPFRGAPGALFVRGPPGAVGLPAGDGARLCRGLAAPPRRRPARRGRGPSPGTGRPPRAAGRRCCATPAPWAGRLQALGPAGEARGPSGFSPATAETPGPSRGLRWPACTPPSGPRGGRGAHECVAGREWVVVETPFPLAGAPGRALRVTGTFSARVDTPPI